MVLKRIDHLQEFERVPHQYNKRDNEYWTSDIFEQRRKRPHLCVDPREDEEVPLMQDNGDSMSVSKIKGKLKELNIKTKIGRADKLKQLLKNAIAKHADYLYLQQM